MRFFHRVVEWAGSLPVYFVVFLVLFLVSPEFISLPFCVMLLLVTVVVYVLKAFFPRARPGRRLREGSWWAVAAVVDRSFPSAHAAWSAGLFAVSWFFGSWLPFAAGAFFLVVSWSRVAAGRHRVSEVVVGALIGMALGVASWYLSFPVAGWV
ncbi:phosphatase PAP2 family protein [Candidatus Woesearchaeota archaeon]|nr:phosphatase PAP2 family protein [Candidatus Woesearchaeota archaeon]